MGLVVVERFSVLSEALVARGALQSAGIPALVAEENHGVADPLIHVALQGFRLCVPASTLEDAAVLLVACRTAAAEAEPSDIPLDRRPAAVVAFAVLAGVFLGGEGAFLVESIRRRGHVWPVALVTATAAFAVIFSGILLVAWEDPCEPGTRRAQSAQCVQP